MTTPTIIYTHTDEAPALATYSFLPIIRAFADRVVNGSSKPETANRVFTQPPPIAAIPSSRLPYRPLSRTQPRHDRSA